MRVTWGFGWPNYAMLCHKCLNKNEHPVHTLSNSLSPHHTHTRTRACMPHTAGFLALLDEPESDLKLFALKRLDEVNTFSTLSC
jgi:hypothetical protein